MREYMFEVLSLFLHNLCVDVVDGHELLDLVVYCCCFHGYDNINQIAWHSIRYQELSQAF